MLSIGNKQTRLQEVVGYTKRSKKDIAAHLGIDRTTLNNYIDGSRSISLVHAQKLMTYCGLELSLLHNNEPIHTHLTGLQKIDQIILELYNVINLKDDECAHYFSEDYVCCSKSYDHHDRDCETSQNGIEWVSVSMGFKSAKYGVSRAVEWESFRKRVDSGQTPTSRILQAEIVNEKKLMVVVEITWSREEEVKDWNLSRTYRSIDFLKFKNTIDNVEACKSPCIIVRKMWAPAVSSINAMEPVHYPDLYGTLSNGEKK